jgi:hypothetical protein
MTVRTVFLAAVLLAGCASIQPPPDTARLPPAALGSNGDNDTQAIGIAAWVFADPSRVRNDPVDAARGAAAVDYLAGELSSNPRWAPMDPLIRMQMLRARAELRSALGVAPGARSQAVVDGLLGVSFALLAGDQQAALDALRTPVFTLGPEQTLARLTSLPYLPETNIATMRANSVIEGVGPDVCRSCS